ncbi:GTP-binding protein HflX [Reichenbachiella agariperforans]|uniref:GTPase HflX n=1 Tax=Reichenbachiella agariperforans TaxID=156994 RepID=A0A1M6TTZ4_REIAG|nr:GTPase HflX [Reichenbachiella agariperforans]SHK60411.1 GTP-binding protein HflX [Reichenbachiella agariperforans]
MGDYYLTEKETERAVLVALSPQKQSEEKTQEYLDELEFLASTLGIETSKTFVQKLDKPDIRSFVGKGKLEEIHTYVVDREINIVIFDDDLTPSQLRNLERDLEVKIYDRSLLILDIFLKRAKTAQAKTQVELARYQYLMPRLTRMWTHLERQRGGTGTRGGAGEKEIETDRRMIRDQIAVLKKKLEKIDKQGETRRKSREGVVRVALVGYTNVGKSTIMKMLCKEEEIYAKDELFATVDSTVRKVVINTVPFLLSDTVGFIRKLPHNLIESFKSTLEEVREADILLHVVDISHPSFEEQMTVVNDTLTELGAGDKEMIVVYNKIDQLGSPEEGGFDFSSGIDTTSTSKTNIFISAVKKQNVAEFRRMLFEKVKKHHLQIYPNYLAPDYY